MKKIIAKFNSICPDTNLKIKKGETIYYDYKNKKAYHITSKKVDEIIEAENIKSYIDAQETAYFDKYSTSYYNY